ncbi:MAG TPA: acetyl-CoA C-acyltransferase FadI [Longimicrobiales bacterium]|nr:acetyl-CoA C-acyltransferase FadI [Longimicrobiales bacterium]
MSIERTGRRVAVVAGCRTPFCKAGTALRHMSAEHLGIIAVRELIARTGIAPEEVGELVYGTVVPSVTAPNIAREVALGAGLPPTVPAFTVSRACASANQAMTSAADIIARGHADVVIAGGAESLSDVPVLLSQPLRQALLAASRARGTAEKLRAIKKIRPRDLLPVAPAIAEPSTGETMGESAERMAKENRISRDAQDRWALRSHRLAAEGTADGRLTAEIVPVYPPPDYAPAIASDNGIRVDTSLEQLSKLPPVFDRRYGTVTAGNSSPLTDGASAVLLMSEEAARARGIRPLGYIRDWAYTALAPAGQLLLGPAYAIPLALDRAGITMRDVDLVEMHEAFSAQVLSTLQALDSNDFARNELGRDKRVGIPDEDQINVMGGSIAIGHPFGATGARLVTTLLNELRRREGNIGLVSVCAAGGMGHAMVLEAA